MTDDSFFAEFDAYCDENNITEEEAPQAFAAFLHLKTGWDGESQQVAVSTEPTKGE